MKIPVGIVGYGNLGKAVEKCLKSSDIFECKAIFSKRDLPNTEKVKNIMRYKNKISLLFLCGGSQNELETQAFEYIQNFNIIESYDNHQRLKNYILKLDNLCKSYRKIALCSFGWDPGIFSFMRGLFDCLGYHPFTFWGKGLSQGHTQAIKNIPHVKDAVQFTIPKEEIINKIKKGDIQNQGKHFHIRECFVVAEEKYQEKIKNQIENMKDYFKGYETYINFISQDKLDSMKSFAHKGIVLTKDNVMNFSLNLPSNPDFTAGIMTTFAKSITWLKEKKKYGSHTIFDLPLSCIVEDKFKFL